MTHKIKSNTKKSNKVSFSKLASYNTKATFSSLNGKVFEIKKDFQDRKGKKMDKSSRAWQYVELKLHIFSLALLHYLCAETTRIVSSCTALN